MASSVAVFFVFLMTVACFASSLEARRLLEVQEMEKKMVVPSLDERLYLNALPKGKVPASTPSNKGHAQIMTEKLIARHLAAIDRILRSVPSPGVGH